MYTYYKILEITSTTIGELSLMCHILYSKYKGKKNQTAFLISCTKHTTLQLQEVMYRVPSVLQNAEEIL